MAKINLNSISPSVFEMRENGQKDQKDRNDIVLEGRTLFYEHARRGQKALYKAMQKADGAARNDELTAKQYKALNETFQAEHLLYAARKCAEATGETAPESFDDFKKQGMRYYNNRNFLNVLQGIYQEIVNPILPAVYSEAVSVFADVVEVGFAETYALSVGSNDIPIFQDSAWGASRSVPANRFYEKDYALNPSPRTAEIRAKWHQLVGNGIDFGMFFANLAAGMYAKTMGLWSAMMTAAASNTALIPSGLTNTFSSLNWVTLANKLAAVNNTSLDNIIAYGNAVALAKVLPTQATGSSNVDMDAALSVLLGRDYIRNAQLGEFMRVRLMPLMDAVVPGTQNTGVTTILDSSKIWLMAANGRKPLTIAYNSATPISIEIRPEETSSFELIFNMTIALDAVAVFASKVGLITI